MKTAGEESSTSSWFSAGHQQILHTISSAKERKPRHCLRSVFSCTNESSRMQRHPDPPPSASGTRLLVYIVHMTEKLSQSVNPPLQTLACCERLGAAEQPEEFALSRLRCIVGLSFVLISSRGDCHDSRSYGQNGSAIIAAKGCVTKKIVYWRHNGPPAPWRTLVENGPQAF